MNIHALVLFLLFTLWHSATLVMVYKDVPAICISVDQEENLPQGESESDAGTESYIHDISLFSEISWNLFSTSDITASAVYTKSFYLLLSPAAFFTPPEV